MIKRILSILLALLILSCLYGCNQDDRVEDEPTETTADTDETELNLIEQTESDYIISTEWMTFYFSKVDFKESDVEDIAEEAVSVMADVRNYLKVKYNLEEAKETICYFDSTYRNKDGQKRSWCFWDEKKMYCISPDDFVHEYVHMISENIDCMSYMEDDDHLDTFLDTYASREDMARSSLLFKRYKMREELDKIEPVRHGILWYELSHIITAANDWQVYLCKDPNHFIWFCETQLNYLNAVNNLSPDKKQLISGGTGADLWCEERIQLGIRYAASFARLGKMDEAYDAFEDTIRVIEQIMSITDDEFKIGCSSPALEGFSLESKINWLEKDGKEYKEISLQYNDWWNWIIPLDYQKAFKHAWFDTMRADKRFDVLFERLDKCVVCREISTN